MSTAQENFTVRRRDDVLLSKTEAEGLLVDQTNGQVHVVNGTAARLWELCEGGPTVEQLTASLADSYAVERAVVSEDVDTMLSTFRELGLIELVAPR